MPIDLACTFTIKLRTGKSVGRMDKYAQRKNGQSVRKQINDTIPLVLLKNHANNQFMPISCQNAKYFIRICSRGTQKRQKKLKIKAEVQHTHSESEPSSNHPGRLARQAERGDSPSVRPRTRTKEVSTAESSEYPPSDREPGRKR